MAKWEELNMADRAAYMRIAVKNGYRDIRSIREAYNKYEDGGGIENGTSVDPKTVFHGQKYNDKGYPTEEWLSHMDNVVRYANTLGVDYDNETPYDTIVARINKQYVPHTTSTNSYGVYSLMDALNQSVDNDKKMIKSIAQGYKKGQEKQYEETKEKIYPYKLMAESLATGAELLSSAYILGKGLKGLGWLPNNNIINGIYQNDKGQILANTLGTAADGYQLITADSTSDKVENSIELPADVAGIIGGTNWFRNTPFFGRHGRQIDNTLDALGYGAAGYDLIFKPIKTIFEKTFLKEE